MNVYTSHTILITIHAAAAIVAFLTGLPLLFFSKHASLRRVYALYRWAIAAFVVFLGFAMICYWPLYSNSQKIIFPALLLLAFYMLYRALDA